MKVANDLTYSLLQKWHRFAPFDLFDHWYFCSCYPVLGPFHLS